MKRAGLFFGVVIVFCSLQSLYGKVGTIESVDEFKQETRHGMVAVLWYYKNPAHEQDKEWNKMHENVQKAYKKIDSKTNYVRFFTADLAKPSLAPLQQEHGLSVMPDIAGVSLYKDGSKQAVLQSITTKSWRLMRDELNLFIRDNLGSTIRELEKRHKREHELAEEEDDDRSGSNVSIGLYAGYPVEYYDDPYYYGPYSYGYYPYGSLRRHHHYYGGSGRGGSRSLGGTRRSINSYHSSGSGARSFGGHGGRGRGRR